MSNFCDSCGIDRFIFKNIQFSSVESMYHLFKGPVEKIVELENELDATYFQTIEGIFELCESLLYTNYFEKKNQNFSEIKIYNL